MKALKWYYFIRGFFILVLLCSFISVYFNPNLFSFLFIPANIAVFLLIRYLFYGRKNQDPSDRRLVLMISLNFLWLACVFLLAGLLKSFSFDSVNAYFCILAASVLISGLA
jgi:hypothetical protein